MLWLLSKEAAGHSDVIRVELGRLFEHLLEPMGREAKSCRDQGGHERIP
jgi:hypothetical protein